MTIAPQMTEAESAAERASVEVMHSVSRFTRYLWGNWKVALGLGLIALIILIGFVGPLIRDPKLAIIGAVELNKAPSAKYPLGTDSTGRDMLALVIVGTPNSFKVGMIAGLVGTAVGVVLGIITGYFRGPVDTVIRSLADIMMMIPSIAVLIIIAATVRVMSLEAIAFIVAIFAWAHPTRLIRSQVLTLRERAFIEIAKLSGVSDLRIIFQEIMPNLLPFLVASFVGAVSGGILASIGLEMLGLGPQRIPSLGSTLYWALFHAAIMRGMWWWWGPPIVILVLIFSGLFLFNIGLDEIANPKLKGAKE
jgi:peptide/nickel transport system permease protein